MKNSLVIIAVYGVRHLLTGNDNDKELPIYIVYDSNGPRIIGHYFSLQAALEALTDELNKKLIEDNNEEPMDKSEKDLIKKDLINRIHEYSFNDGKLSPLSNNPITDDDPIINDEVKETIEDYLNEILGAKLTHKPRKIN